MDHPSAHLFAGGWTGPRRLAEGRRPTTPQRGRCGGCVAVMMILTIKKEKGWSSGPVQLDHPGWRRKVAQSHLQAISGRRPLDHPPWSKVVQGGPVWSGVVQSEYTPRRAPLR